MKKLIALCGLVLGTFVGAAPAGAAPVLTFAPASNHVNVGDSVTIDATISGLGAEALTNYDLNFTYNPALLNWQSITQFVSPFNVHFSAINIFDSNVEGNLGFLLNSLDTDADVAANQADSFQLFSFVLKGVADGVTSFTLGPDADFDRNFVGLGGNILDVSVGAACIAVGTGACNAVPEPGTYALVAMGLLAVGIVGRKRRRTGVAA